MADRDAVTEKAEALIREKFGPDLRERFGSDDRTRLYELAVDQLDLEMQNKELRRSSAVLEETRSFYNRLFRYSPVACLILDKEGNIVDASYEAVTVFKKDEALMLKSSAYSLVADDAQAVLKDHLADVFESDGTRTVDVGMHREGGTRFAARLYSIRSASGLSRPPRCWTAVLDKTRDSEMEVLLSGDFSRRTRALREINRELEKEIAIRKQTEADLKMELNFRKAVEKTIPCGISLADHDGRILYVNPTFCRMFGYSESELLNQYPPYAFWPDYEEDKRMRCFHKVQSEPAFDNGQVKKYFRKNGEMFWGLFSLAPLEISGHEEKGFLASIFDITAQKEAEENLAASEKKQRNLARKLIDAQEAERIRIAKDLHDSIGSSLVAVRFLLERKLREFGATDCRQDICLENVVDMVQDIVSETRRISQNLHPQILERLGLGAALASYCGDFQQQRPGIQLETDIDVPEERVTESLKLIVFRLVQGGLANVTKHSRADRVGLTVKETQGTLLFELTDNGIGFDTQKVMKDGFVDDSGSLGLESMRERVESSGGRFSLEPGEDGGSRFYARWPL